MTTTTNDGVTLYYETGDESGTAGRKTDESDSSGADETIAFVGDAGFGAWQWAWQSADVAGPRETLVWDLRGTGRSDAPDGPYDVETMATDLEAVLADSGTRRAHLVGAGLGGMIALRYARRYGRAKTLTLFGTPASGAAVEEPALRALNSPSEDEQVLRRSLKRAFSEEFHTAQRETIEQICEWRTGEDATEAGFEAQVAAICEFESGPLYELTLPTLVCHGLDDPVVPVEAGQKLADDLPRGTFEAVEGRRLCYIEHSRAVNDRVLDFLDEQ